MNRPFCRFEVSRCGHRAFFVGDRHSGRRGSVHSPPIQSACIKRRVTYMMITTSLGLCLFLDRQVFGHFETKISSTQQGGRTRIGSLRIQAVYPFLLQVGHVKQVGQNAFHLVQPRSLVAGSRPPCTSVEIQLIMRIRTG